MVPLATHKLLLVGVKRRHNRLGFFQDCGTDQRGFFTKAHVLGQGGWQTIKKQVLWVLALLGRILRKDAVGTPAQSQFKVLGTLANDSLHSTVSYGFGDNPKNLQRKQQARLCCEIVQTNTSTA